MKEIKTYEIKNSLKFFNIIIEEEDCYEFYLGCKGYGDLMYMFGLPKETYTLESIKEIAKDSSLEYVKEYIENYIKE